MTRVSAARLLGLPVRLHGIQLGRPVDLVLDRERRRVLGFDVRCGDEERRFLPLAAAAVSADALVISSPLVLLEEAQLAFYTERGSTFVALRGTAVAQAGKVVGTLADLELERDGTVAAVDVDARGTRRQIAHADDVVIGAKSVRAAS